MNGALEWRGDGTQTLTKKMADPGQRVQPSNFDRAIRPIDRRQQRPFFEILASEKHLPIISFAGHDSPMKIVGIHRSYAHHEIERALVKFGDGVENILWAPQWRTGLKADE